MKEYLLSRRMYIDFCRLLQSLVGSSDISGITQYPIIDEDKMEVKLVTGARSIIRGYLSCDNVRVEIDEEEKTVSQLLEKYIKDVK